MTREHLKALVEKIAAECTSIRPLQILAAEETHLNEMIDRVTSARGGEFQATLTVVDPEGYTLALHSNDPDWRKLVRATLRSRLADVSNRLTLLLEKEPAR